jgi:glycosyltransferase involved in cell wall biosynthesis
MPRVSVIMPCFNHAPFVADSLHGVLQQTHPDWELIVVDDCSRDGSWEVIRRVADHDPRIRAIRHERNQGVSKSRNDGLRAASGELIGFCDADDIWEREKLERQADLLRKNPDYDVVYCDAAIVDEKGLSTGERFSDRFPPPPAAGGWLFAELIRRNFINIQTVLMRKECVQHTGFFDEGVRWVEDWLYWIRLSRRHRFLYCPDLLARYRVHRRSTNLVQRRGYSVNRFKVFRRILRDYGDLPKSARNEIVYKMGVDLCDLGKRVAGRRLLWSVVAAPARDIRSLASSGRALRRLLMNAGHIRTETGNPSPDRGDRAKGRGQR